MPSLLTQASQGAAASGPTPQQLLSQGLAKIPGLSASQRATLSQVPASSLTTPTTTPTTSSTDTLGSGTQLPVKAPVTDQQANQGSGGLLGGLLHGTLGVAHFFGSLW